MAFTQQVSIHGRRLSITTTGGIASGHGATGGLSTAVTMAAQMWGDAMVETSSGGTGSIGNVGVTTLSSDSTSGSAFVLAAPVKGVYKEIISLATATAVTINTSATTILFQTTAAQSTAMTLGATNNTGQAITLRGISTTLWAVVSKTAGIS